jgi:hypothetical protein
VQTTAAAETSSRVLSLTGELIIGRRQRSRHFLADHDNSVLPQPTKYGSVEVYGGKRLQEQIDDAIRLHAINVWLDEHDLIR